ncbi:MAG: hypothetical protein J1F60_04620 [Oscillospiraceae bacterium]|nr:hypothetical protein [Oscillospiraceae bacterium]
MQEQQNYQYGYGQNQQVNQTDPYNQGYNANPYTQTNDFSQPYQQPTYASAAVKKKVNPAVIIVPIAIVAVAAIVVLMIMLFSGSGGYKGAEEKYFSQLFGGFSSAAKDTKNAAATPQKITVSFDVSNNQIADYIGMSGIYFETETASKGNDIYARMGIELGKEYFDCELWYDDKAGEIMMLLPDISSIYLQASLDAYEESGSELDVDKAYQALLDVVNKTMETYFEVVGETEIESGLTFRVARESYTADRVRIKLDSAQMATIIKAFLENFIENDDIMDVLCTYLDEDEDYVIEMMGIEDAIEQMEDVIEGDDDSEVSFKMDVWMQGGNIVGREIEITDYTGRTAAEISFFQVPTSNGSVTYFEIPDVVEYTAKDEVKGQLHTGSATLSFNTGGYYSSSTEITVEYSDLAITDKLFQGEIRAYVSGSEGFELRAELSTEGNTKIASVSIPNICRATVTVGPSQLKFQEMPSPSSSQVVVFDSDGDFMYDEAYEEFMEDIMDYFSDLLGNNYYW